jgi:hypothetical protein
VFAEMVRLNEKFKENVPEMKGAMKAKEMMIVAKIKKI